MLNEINCKPKKWRKSENYENEEKAEIIQFFNNRKINKRKQMQVPGQS